MAKVRSLSGLSLLLLRKGSQNLWFGKLGRPRAPLLFRMLSTEGDDIRSRKQTVRKQVRANLRALTGDEIVKQSLKVWERLFQLPEYQQARSVGLFLSMPSGEIQTEMAIRHAVANGKHVYVPQVGKNFEQAEMELLKVPIKNQSDSELFYESWPRNKWHIPEPPSELEEFMVAATPGDIDVLVVPGLAFDRVGNRLGQGKGYYDRFIARMCAASSAKPPTLVAVSLECQLVDEIPVHTYDRSMDFILLPNETLTVVK